MSFLYVQPCCYYQKHIIITILSTFWLVISKKLIKTLVFIIFPLLKSLKGGIYGIPRCSTISRYSPHFLIFPVPLFPFTDSPFLFLKIAYYITARSNSKQLNRLAGNIQLTVSIEIQTVIKSPIKFIYYTACKTSVI